MTLDELQIAPGLVRRERPRPPVARDARPLRDPRQRGHAAADAGRPRDRALDGLARALADRRGAGRREHRRRRARLVGARLQPARRQPAARSTGRRRCRRVPAHRPRVRELPGIGPYTASAIACFAFGAQLTTVDVNVRRVLERALGDEPPPPAGRAWEWNQALFDLGATVCLARIPRCEPARSPRLPLARHALRAGAQAGPLRRLDPRTPRRARARAARRPARGLPLRSRDRRRSRARRPADRARRARRAPRGDLHDDASRLGREHDPLPRRGAGRARRGARRRAARRRRPARLRRGDRRRRPREPDRAPRRLAPDRRSPTRRSSRRSPTSTPSSSGSPRRRRPSSARTASRCTRARARRARASRSAPRSTRRSSSTRCPPTTARYASSRPRWPRASPATATCA